VQAGGYAEARYWTRAAQKEVWRDGRVKAWNDDKSREGPHNFGKPFNLPNHPVVGITWYEALAFCRWLEEQLQVTGCTLSVWTAAGEKMREVKLAPGTFNVHLPTEPQWEKAVRGTDGRVYPWGDEADPNRANYADTGIGTTSAVGCFPGGVSPYGIEDLSGNVWEWCRTKWEGNYGDYKNDNDMQGTDRRVLRGGAFHSSTRFVRCAYRYHYSPLARSRYLGFRVVVSPFSRTE
jgi:formylglycine-generating enzyme required for sulfatase activity